MVYAGVAAGVCNVCVCGAAGRRARAQHACGYEHSACWQALQAGQAAAAAAGSSTGTAQGSTAHLQLLVQLLLHLHLQQERILQLLPPRAAAAAARHRAAAAAAAVGGRLLAALAAACGERGEGSARAGGQQPLLVGGDNHRLVAATVTTTAGAAPARCPPQPAGRLAGSSAAGGGAAGQQAAGLAQPGNAGGGSLCQGPQQGAAHTLERAGRAGSLPPSSSSPSLLLVLVRWRLACRGAEGMHGAAAEMPRSRQGWPRPRRSRRLPPAAAVRREAGAPSGGRLLLPGCAACPALPSPAQRPLTFAARRAAAAAPRALPLGGLLLVPGQLDVEAVLLQVALYVVDGEACRERESGQAGLGASAGTGDRLAVRQAGRCADRRAGRQAVKESEEGTGHRLAARGQGGETGGRRRTGQACWQAQRQGGATAGKRAGRPRHGPGSSQEQQRRGAAAAPRRLRAAAPPAPHLPHPSASGCPWVSPCPAPLAHSPRPQSGRAGLASSAAATSGTERQIGWVLRAAGGGARGGGTRREGRRRRGGGGAGRRFCGRAASEVSLAMAMLGCVWRAEGQAGCAGRAARDAPCRGQGGAGGWGRGRPALERSPGYGDRKACCWWCIMGGCWYRCWWCPPTRSWAKARPAACSGPRPAPPPP